MAALQFFAALSFGLGGPIEPDKGELRSIDGVWQFESPTYQITIGPDGNVRSLTAGGTPILEPGPDRKAGAFFLDEKDAVAGFSRVELRGANEVVCTQDSAEVRYTFFPDHIEMRRTNAGRRYANWAWFPSSHVNRSLDALHDGAMDLVKPPFDGFQANARWLTDRGAVVHMPCMNWVRKEKVAPDRNVALLQHYGCGDEQPFVIRPVPLPRAADALVFKIQCEDPDFLVPGGRKELFAAGVENPSTNAFNVTARFRVLTYLDRQPVSSVDTLLKVAGGQSQPLPLTAALKESAAYRAELTLRDGDQELRRLEWVFAYDWGNWKLPLTRQPDFEDFWKQTLEELRRRPLDAVLTRAPDRDLPGFKVYQVNFRALGERRCYGWYCVPEGEGPFPAQLALPGNGVYKLSYPFRGPMGRHVQLVIQVHGYDVDLSNLPNPWPWRLSSQFGYWGEWPSREKAFARVVYTNCVRAVDFLMSRPEVAQDRVWVDGMSQGGGLAAITAGLDHRVKYAVVYIPALLHLDWTYRWFPDAPFPWNGNNPKPEGMDDHDFLRILSYYDAANFVPDIQCPVTALIALQDTVVPGGAAVAALRNLTSPLTLVNGVWVDHRADERMNNAYLAGIRQFLEGGEAK